MNCHSEQAMRCRSNAIKTRLYFAVMLHSTPCNIAVSFDNIISTTTNPVYKIASFEFVPDFWRLLHACEQQIHRTEGGLQGSEQLLLRLMREQSIGDEIAHC